MIVWEPRLSAPGLGQHLAIEAARLEREQERAGAHPAIGPEPLGKELIVSHVPLRCRDVLLDGFGDCVLECDVLSDGLNLQPLPKIDRHFSDNDLFGRCGIFHERRL